MVTRLLTALSTRVCLKALFLALLFPIFIKDLPGSILSKLALYQSLGKTKDLFCRVEMAAE